MKRYAITLLFGVLAALMAFMPTFASAHPLGFNGIPESRVIEAGMDTTTLNRDVWLPRRDTALQRLTTWRNNNNLGPDGVPAYRKPVDTANPTTGIFKKDNSSDAYLMYFDVNTSPDTYGINTQVANGVPSTHLIGSMQHELLHATGGAHPGNTLSEQRAFCEETLLASLAACQRQDGTFFRITSPGTHDTRDARATDENGGFSDYSEIGSYPAAGDTAGVVDPNDPTIEDQAPYKSDETVIERYGEPGDSEEEALAEAEAAGVVFEVVE